MSQDHSSDTRINPRTICPSYVTNGHRSTKQSPHPRLLDASQEGKSMKHEECELRKGCRTLLKLFLKITALEFRQPERALKEMASSRPNTLSWEDYLSSFSARVLTRILYGRGRAGEDHGSGFTGVRVTPRAAVPPVPPPAAVTADRALPEKPLSRRLIKIDKKRTQTDGRGAGLSPSLRTLCLHLPKPQRAPRLPWRHGLCAGNFVSRNTTVCPALIPQSRRQHSPIPLSTSEEEGSHASFIYS
ncbi:hypothetical protein SKAU_G00054000 [Synaphobranchus kaupii]|uniref:Uncharacterized protein n=1 Tax=Synaphobranchus kaupii TaxID=118154 RepID=A0A9Q1JA21_SYNKA|nr:hypothetical protein SKAU_G00054000 [Synaphobranchus kaupii]